MFLIYIYRRILYAHVNVHHEHAGCQVASHWLVAFGAFFLSGDSLLWLM